VQERPTTIGDIGAFGQEFNNFRKREDRGGEKERKVSERGRGANEYSGGGVRSSRSHREKISTTQANKKILPRHAEPGHPNGKKKQKIPI